MKRTLIKVSTALLTVLVVSASAANVTLQRVLIFALNQVATPKNIVVVTVRRMIAAR